MGKKKEWERKFEEYDINAETKKIDVLTEKLNNKTITKEEYSELKRWSNYRKRVKWNPESIRNCWKKSKEY